jgi:hypothetical protein
MAYSLGLDFGEPKAEKGDGSLEIRAAFAAFSTARPA